jgi:hypothetical protein
MEKKSFQHEFDTKLPAIYTDSGFKKPEKFIFSV